MQAAGMWLTESTFEIYLLQAAMMDLCNLRDDFHPKSVNTCPHPDTRTLATSLSL